MTRRISISAEPRRSQALNLVRGSGPVAEQVAAAIPVVWPRYVGSRVVMTPIHPSHIPPGWQSVQIHVPMRMVSCEEVDCPMFTGGWTEVEVAGEPHPKAGKVTEDEAAASFGLFGPHGIPPTVIQHEPGTPCPRIHKVPSGIPPLYTVDGSPVLWNQFEDAIGGGLEQARRTAG